jgi:hypothetical protein
MSGLGRWRVSGCGCGFRCGFGSGLGSGGSSGLDHYLVTIKKGKGRERFQLQSLWKKRVGVQTITRDIRNFF